MDENNVQIPLSLENSVSQHEDAALKTSMQFFADELLPYFGITGKAAAIAPTELVHLEAQKFFQDFNLIMEDGTMKHFEFQSTNPGLAGLKRFRTYEALASSHYRMAVTTYVLYSGTIRNPMTEFTEGINTYRIVPIIMQDKNADAFLAALQNKLDNQLPITRQELIPLTLCLLMGGQMPLKDRVRTAYKITGSVPTDVLSVNEVQKIESVIYTLAEKFLDSIDLEEIMEEISMTRLGQMLVNKGCDAPPLKSSADFEVTASFSIAPSG